MVYDEFEMYGPDGKDEDAEFDEKEAFKACSLRDKNDLGIDIKYRKHEFAKKAETDNIRPAAFYSTLQDLLDRFLDRLENTILFKELEMWWAYEYEVKCTGVTLSLQHLKDCNFDKEGAMTGCEVDEQFDLFTVEAKLLTVEEYSKKYGVEPVTIRQWIRRAKLRSVVKMGKEWRIPELAIPGQRGYSSASYTWKYPLSDIPDEFAFLRDPASLFISKSSTEKDSYTIEYSYLSEPEDAPCHNMSINEKERVKIEMLLIGNPLVKCDADSFGNFS